VTPGSAIPTPASPTHGCFTLTFQGDDGAERTQELSALDGVALTIGRLSTNGLALKHPTLSRQHAQVVVRGRRCYLSDFGSTAGTRVNGQRIEKETELREGDTFTLGAVPFRVGWRTVHPSVALSDSRHDADSSGTIFRPVDASLLARGAADASESARLKRLLADISRTLTVMHDLPHVLESVVDMVFDAVVGERAILLLHDPVQDVLTPRVARHIKGDILTDARLSRTVVNTVMRDRVAMLADDALHDERLDMAQSIVGLNIRSFMCAPLWNRDRVIGVLYVDNPRSRRFSEDDLAVFVALANCAAVAIEQARLAEQVLEETRRRERLQRYHSPGVVDRILNADTDTGAFDTQLREVTVVFVDLVGFTAMSETLEPVDVAATLNEFFSEMTDVIFEHQGTLDKFLGDGLLAVFGAPLPHDGHATNAVRAAIQMRQVLGNLNARRAAQPLEMRVAIHTGRALTGDIGSPKRRDFTVLGDVVNTASRMESSITRPGQIVVSKETLDQTAGAFRATPLGTFTLRGRQSPVEAYAVED
jgi:adenylate cyclase